MLSNSPKEKDDPRFKRTHQLLLQAFIDVLDQKGFQAVSVQDVTGRAGVNRATFYAHFQDKYALLDYSVRQWFRQQIEQHMLNACQFSMQNLRQLIIAVCEFVDYSNSHCKPAESQFESLVEAQVKQELFELLTKWLEQVKVDLAPEVAATAASWAIYGLALQWSHAKAGKSAEAFADEVLPLVGANLRLVQTA
jgi:AcrR family transcriptional regulator